MACSIVVMPTARRQFIAACDWWRANRPVAPTLLEHELDHALLAERPNLGAPWPRRPGVRRLVLGRVGYLILYQLRSRAQRVEILALWHGSRGEPPRRL